MDKRPPAYTYLCLHSSFNSPTTILVLIGEQFFVSSVRIQSRLPDGMPAHRELDVKARWRTLQKVTLNVQHGHVLEVGPDQVAAKQIPAELPKWLLFCLFLIIPFLIPLSFSIKRFDIPQVIHSRKLFFNLSPWLSSSIFSKGATTRTKSGRLETPKVSGNGTIICVVQSHLKFEPHHALPLVLPEHGPCTRWHEKFP